MRAGVSKDGHVKTSDLRSMAAKSFLEIFLLGTNTDVIGLGKFVVRCMD